MLLLHGRKEHVMENRELRGKLVDLANLLKDLTVAIIALAREFGDVKVDFKGQPVKEEALNAIEAVAEPGKPAIVATEGKKYSLEEVRKVLAAKSGAGFTAEVRELLKKHGADKLSGVAEAEYPEIIREAEVIGNGNA